VSLVVEIAIPVDVSARYIHVVTSDSDWLLRSDWSRRSPEFGGLRVHASDGASFVAMEFAPLAGLESPAPEPLWRLWLGLHVHRNILQAVGRHWLRYAALDWSHQPLAIGDDPEAATRVATWGAKLTWVCEFLLRSVPGDSLGWMATPIVKFDLEGEIRIAFIAPDWNKPNSLPPEVVAQWPQCDERGLVFMVGRS
jgi:hypothetical protein